MKGRVGFVGLGLMGLPMATNLLSAGFEVSGWARRQEGVQRGADAGLTMRPTLQALAEDRGYVVTMLTASEDLLDVALRSGGLVESMPKGSVLIDMSTVAPAASRQVAELCRENGLDFLDAPVSGGVTGAEHGTLTVMVGGEAAVLERCRPLLEVMGDSGHIFHAGEVGSGEIAKLVNNMMAGTISAATIEAMLIGVKAGVPLKTLIDVVTVSSGSSAQLTGQLSRNAFIGRFEPGFMTDLLVKDLRLAVELASQVRAPAPFTALAQALFEEASARGRGRQDYGALVLELERKAGTVARL